jgi:MauM/NapG family ferredoxin protein
MSGAPKPNKGRGLSRRDFVRGRFWRALGLGRSSSAKAASPPTRRRRTLVMRYPKSLREVAAGDNVAPPEPETDSAAVSTSETVRGALPDAATAARRRTIPVLRPPGAVDEESFLAGCTRCKQCIEVCPHDAITLAPDRMREAALTPMIDPDRQPCMMCEDFPCITTCEPGVLTQLVPKMMGTAKVTEHLCLAHHSTTCTVCSERCPVEAAISVSDGKPTVNETVCTGCGVCRYVCPAPENAILLMPTFLRPSPSPRPLDE